MASSVSTCSPETEQSSPRQPGSHAHSPQVALHAPWPEHSLGHSGPLTAGSTIFETHVPQSAPP